MFSGIDPKKMQAMMKQMGIAQEQVDANRVIIECDDKNIIINNPSTTRIKMQGQQQFQISGDVEEQETTSTTQEQPKEPQEDHTEDDIKTIIEKTGKSEQEAKQALEQSNGDLTEALISLS